LSYSPVSRSPHEFHIPVLGTGFSVDTPIKVARYGIDSVMSVVDDELLEQVRRCHSEREGIEYRPIAKSEEDSRARRTKAYLDLVGRLIREGFQEVLDSFPDGAEAKKYFALLPDCPQKRAYEGLPALPAGAERDRVEAELKAFMRPDGSLARIPPKEKQKLVVLKALAERFERGRDYGDAELREILKPVHEDYALLRRYLVDYRFLERDEEGRRYRRP